MIHWLTVGVPFLKQQNPWSEIPAGGHNRRRSRGVSVYVRVLRKPWNPTVIKRGERCAGVLTAVLPSPFKTLLLLHSPTAGRAVKTGFLGIHIHPPSHTHTHTLLIYLTYLFSPVIPRHCFIYISQLFWLYSLPNMKLVVLMTWMWRPDVHTWRIPPVSHLNKQCFCKMLLSPRSGWDRGSLGPPGWDWEATGPGGWFRARRRQTGAWLGASLLTTVGSCSHVNILSTDSKWNAEGGEEVDRLTGCVYQILGTTFISGVIIKNSSLSLYSLYVLNTISLRFIKEFSNLTESGVPLSD